MFRNQVYLDYNANAPVLPAVRDCIHTYLELVGNPAAAHGAGKTIRSRIEAARTQVAKHLDADPQNITFTSGGTEGNNLGIRGFPDHHLFTTEVEHASLWTHIHHRPHTLIPTDAQGRICLEQLEHHLKDHTGPKLVAVCYANNETGVLNPVADIIDLARRYGALVLVDAVQAVGKIPLSFRKLGTDMVTLSAHKVGGLTGCGALVVREGVSPQAQLWGGGQERGKRSGTPNTLGILSLGAALEKPINWTKAQEIRAALEKTLQAAAPDAYIYGKDISRLPNTLAISMPGVLASTQMISFDLQGICVSPGSACSSGSIKTSRIFNHINPTHAPWTLRISLGPTTSQTDIDRFVDAWTTLYQEQTKG